MAVQKGRTFSWQQFVPVVLETARDGEDHSVSEYIEAAKIITERDFPLHAHRQLKNRTAYEDRARWATFHARHLGFLETIGLGITRITAAGLSWLEGHPYPLTPEQLNDLRHLKKESEKRRLAKKSKAQLAQPQDSQEDDVLPDNEDYFWVLRAGADGEREERALAENKGIPGMHFGPEAEDAWTVGDLKKAIKGHDPLLTPGKVANFAGQLFRFKNEMQEGDLVLMPSKLQPGKIFVGTVTGRAFVDKEEQDPEARNQIPISWQNEAIERQDFAKDLRHSLASLLTIFQVKRNDALERLQSILDGMGDPNWEEQKQEIEHAKLDWIPFFIELADALRPYRHDRQALLQELRKTAQVCNRPSMFKPLWKWSTTGGQEEATDVDPFTIFATINRGITWPNKSAICAALKKNFGLHAEVPENFSAVPVRNNLSTRFESSYNDPGNPEFYDKLWELFDAGIEYSENGSDVSTARLIQAFNKATEGRSLIGYTVGLYWIRPYTFLALDSNNQAFLRSPDGLGVNITKDITNGSGYLEALNAVKSWLKDSTIEPPTIPRLSETAYTYTPEPKPTPTEGSDVDSETTDIEEELSGYDTASIVEAGCFLSKARLDSIIARWMEKKNIILQGPPGTGKTWLARKLAYAMAGETDTEKITAIQFHPSTSYEDFIQGFRPGGDGKLTLQDGPFLNALHAANEDEASPHIIVIEEINRGNPAQIFGEVLTLLEADKRNSENALNTLYDQDGPALYLPENLYVIGTMNQADRSLAMVDMALRRRFAFINLEPTLNDYWLDFCADKCGRNREVLELIRERLTEVNQLIANDPTLGTAYGIGHSFVTPRRTDMQWSAAETAAWFRGVVDTELIPLLEEYWFDRPDKIDEAVRLLAGVYS